MPLDIYTVIWEGKSFSEPSELLQQFPALKEDNNAVECAKLVNTLLMGNTFEVIVNVLDLQTNSTRPIHGYGLYNVKIIELPKWDNDTLIYFAENTATGVPYKATYIPEHNESHYELLERIS